MHSAAETKQIPWRRGRIDGLDGLRALAVTAVLIFHLAPEWLPGGFLGVDVFFVVSGFLITTLLIRELAKTGKINLVGFWQRRIRRLVPALVLAVTVSVSCAFVASLWSENARDLLYGVPRQILGAATFTSNWLEILAGSSYFDARVPQLFSTFWSLAVEEQFYVFWPLVFVLLTTMLRKPRQRAFIALAVAAASLAWMAVLFDPEQDPTRVYYGTDTHLFGLMLGVAIAFEFSRADGGVFGTRHWRKHGSTYASFGIALLLLLFFLLDETSPFTFRGGLGISSLASALAIAGILAGPSDYTQTLDLKPLRFIGDRSYGIYIWHWPVILILGAVAPTTFGSAGWWLQAILAVAITFALCELSLVYVETPMRRDGIRATLRRWLAAFAPKSPARRQAIALGTAFGLAVTGTVAGAVSAPEMTSVERAIKQNEQALESLKPQAPQSEAPAAPVEQPPAVEINYAPPTGEELTIIGDSMAAVSLPALVTRWPNLQIDAQSNRRWEDVPGIIDPLLEQGAVRRSVVFVMGTNWGIQDPALVEGIVERVQAGRTVVLMNSFGAGWEPGLTEQLQAIAAKYPNVTVADWASVAAANPDKLQSDGVHPNQPGEQLVADTIAAAFEQLAQQH